MGMKLAALGLTAAVLAAPPVIKATGVLGTESAPGRAIETVTRYETLAARFGYAALQEGENAIGVDFLPEWTKPDEEESSDQPVISDMVVIQ